jgi:hypothetical protein
MNWLIKPVVIFSAIISLIIVSPSYCQNTDQIISFSDQQFERKNYELAANEYNRALFFGSTNADAICLKVASCYINLNKPALSALFFDRAYFSATSDSIRTEAILGKSFSLILVKQYMLALSELMNLDSSRISEQNIRLNFLKGIAHFGLNDDKPAEIAFKKSILEASGKNYMNDIEKEFKLITKTEKRYNPHTAWILSLIVPGTGQAYASEYKEAANSAVLLGGLIYLATTFAVKYTALEAIVIILPWFQRYYLGGANKAERLTLEKQERKRNDSYQRILSHIKELSLEISIN